MSAGVVSVAVDPTTQRLLLILTALLVGSSIGLIGALLFGILTRGRARRPHAPVAPPAPAPAHAASEPVAGEPAPAPALSAFVAPAIGSVPVLFALDADAVRERHRELYDAEYAKQLHHMDTLRRTIGTRMAVGAELHKPPEEPEP